MRLAFAALVLFGAAALTSGQPPKDPPPKKDPPKEAPKDPPKAPPKDVPKDEDAPSSGGPYHVTEEHQRRLRRPLKVIEDE